MNGHPEPLVSVCIANYNGERLLAPCIDSVLGQQGAPPFEIIVHDDASTDASLEVLRGYPTVRVIAAQANVGFCISNNRMAAAARGRFLLLLNNDAELLPDALGEMLALSTKLGHTAIVGMPQYDASTRRLIDAGCLLDLHFSPVPLKPPCTRQPAMTIGACLWIPTDTWREIGGFPEWFGTNAEDVYLCCAARWLGHVVAITPGSGYLHAVGQSQGAGKPDVSGRLQLSRSRRYLSERNRALIMRIFLPGWLQPLAFAINSLVLLAEALVLMIALRSPSLPIELHWESQAHAWRMRSRADELRRSLRPLRKVTYGTFFRPFTLVPLKLRLLASHGLPRTR